MPYTIVDDGNEICIRATISQRWELAELVTKLQQRVDGLPVNITAIYPEGDKIEVIPCSGGTTATCTVKAGAVTSVTINNSGPNPYDAQGVNRKELSNER